MDFMCSRSLRVFQLENYIYILCIIKKSVEQTYELKHT